jgi:hypothetical protein
MRPLAVKDEICEQCLHAMRQSCSSRFTIVLHADAAEEIDSERAHHGQVIGVYRL